MCQLWATRFTPDVVIRPHALVTRLLQGEQRPVSDLKHGQIQAAPKRLPKGGEYLSEEIQRDYMMTAPGLKAKTS